MPSGVSQRSLRRDALCSVFSGRADEQMTVRRSYSSRAAAVDVADVVEISEWSRMIEMAQMVVLPRLFLALLPSLLLMLDERLLLLLSIAAQLPLVPKVSLLPTAVLPLPLFVLFIER